MVGFSQFVSSLFMSFIFSSSLCLSVEIILGDRTVVCQIGRVWLLCVRDSDLVYQNMLME